MEQFSTILTGLTQSQFVWLAMSTDPQTAHRDKQGSYFTFVGWARVMKFSFECQLLLGYAPVMLTLLPE